MAAKNESLMEVDQENVSKDFSEGQKSQSSPNKMTEQEGAGKSKSSQSAAVKMEESGGSDGSRPVKKEEGGKWGVRMEGGVEGEGEYVEPVEGFSLRILYDVELACLEDVEVLEDRIINASLQTKVSMYKSIKEADLKSKKRKKN